MAGTVTGRTLGESILEMDAEGAKERLIFQSFFKRSGKRTGQKTIYCKCGNYLFLPHFLFHCIFSSSCRVYFDLNGEESQ